MKTTLALICLTAWNSGVLAASGNGGVPAVITIEAESFAKQTLNDKRSWHITSATSTPGIEPDGDPVHVEGASGGAYIELLPDTRRSHGDKLINGENFTGNSGEMAVLSYPIQVKSPGRYYVWVRAYSTTSEDNGLHFGLDGQWPESGARWQTVKKNGWNWDCKQRTEKVHIGVPMQLWLDIDKAGDHELLMSMREDGIEVDQITLATDVNWKPEGFKQESAQPKTEKKTENKANEGTSPLTMTPSDFMKGAAGYYLDKGKWLAINPEANKQASAKAAFALPSGKYDVTLRIVGESDGQSTYQMAVGDQMVGDFTAPKSAEMFEEGPQFGTTFKGLTLGTGDQITLSSQIASADGKEFSRARIAGLDFAPADEATKAAVASLPAAPRNNGVPAVAPIPRQPHGKGTTAISGELKAWHKVTLTLDGPFAAESDGMGDKDVAPPNPYTDLAFNVTFTHESGSPSYQVPGYFAADGQAANTSASSGTVWRAHLSPDKTGRWNYRISFATGPGVATAGGGSTLAPFDGVTGSFTVAATDKTGRDFRAHGRLTYTGGHYLRFAGTGRPFLKAGPDSPETLLAYADFDGTVSLKKGVPIKTWHPHVGDWRQGDPAWQNGKGKGLIGALNYLAAKGLNSFSFLTYNAAGDGDNVWPFTARDDKFHYDCSKLDQWEIVFAHATQLGLHLHFKLQETENDDQRVGQAKRTPGSLPEALDGGATGPERKLYYRELIARFGHHLALTWNLGEENTQTADEQRAMAAYIAATDPYHHNLVIHTFPEDQDRVYQELLGAKSALSGAALQNEWDHAHQRILHWVRASAAAGRPWIAANDEQGPAWGGVPPDPGYRGFDGKTTTQGKVAGYDLHDIRKATLWGTLMAGGAGVEYLFGYRFAENDLVLEDFRSRDQTWTYCANAIEFFTREKIPVDKMANADELVGNPAHDNSRYCFAKPGELYLVYLPNGGSTDLDLADAKGSFSLQWFNPREGGALKSSDAMFQGGQKASLTAPDENDWLAVIRIK